MKRKLIILFFTAGVMFVSCKKENFVKENIDPNTLYSIAPEEQLLAAAVGSQNDFEYFYDVYRALNFWLQYTTNLAGNSPNFTNPTGNFNYRYGVYYGTVGRDLADIPHIIATMSPEDQAKYANLQNVATIFKAYYTFYVSDINGSIPYTEAFQGRYGGTLTPKYDSQQGLFDTLDLQIKNAVAGLKSSAANQVDFKAKDPFYGTYADEINKWIKAGNALRLKIATRLMKQEPDKLKAIAAEVLADASNQMGSVEDSWVLYVGPSYADGTGNYNPDGFVAGRPVLNFLQSKQDPRLRIFYRPNKVGNYLGSFPSPDDAKLPANTPLYKAEDTLSELQHRLFTPNFDEGDGNGVGDGVGFFPVLTYAEYCFIRADLAARGFTNDNVSEWYNKGVTASITFYDQRAKAAKIAGYTSVSADEITNYLAMPGIAFDASKASDQIACQAYLDFFRQPQEAWAWWKRTGYPNTNSVLAWDVLKSNGAVMTLPRRAPLSSKLPADANYENQKAAYDEMLKDPNFGAGLGDAFGRVWWDKP